MQIRNCIPREGLSHDYSYLGGVVDRLPKTRSGKIRRGTMRCIADRDDWRMPATIEDAGALDGVTETLKKLGYA